MIADPKLIEAVARAIAVRREWRDSWRMLAEDSRRMYQQEAEAAIAAINASGEWWVAPVEADKSMMLAAGRALDIWRETVPGDPQRKAPPDEKHAIRFAAMRTAYLAKTEETKHD